MEPCTRFIQAVFRVSDSEWNGGFNLMCEMMLHATEQYPTKMNF